MTEDLAVTSLTLEGIFKRHNDLDVGMNTEQAVPLIGMAGSYDLVLSRIVSTLHAHLKGKGQVGLAGEFWQKEGSKVKLRCITFCRDDFYAVFDILILRSESDLTVTLICGAHRPLGRLLRTTMLLGMQFSPVVFFFALLFRSDSGELSRYLSPLWSGCALLGFWGWYAVQRWVRREDNNLLSAAHESFKAVFYATVSGLKVK